MYKNGSGHDRGDTRKIPPLRNQPIVYNNRSGKDRGTLGLPLERRKED